MTVMPYAVDRSGRASAPAETERMPRRSRVDLEALGPLRRNMIGRELKAPPWFAAVVTRPALAQNPIRVLLRP